MPKGAHRKLNIINKRFGNLIALEDIGKTKRGYYLWECQCDCGNKTVVKAALLNNGHVKSCGCRRGSQYLSKEEAGLARVIRTYKRHAKQKGLEFELTEKQIKKLTLSDCYYCGAKPAQIAEKYYVYNGIDRVNNSTGYLFDNCVTCCKDCNWAKGQMSQEEFFAKIARIYRKHLK